MYSVKTRHHRVAHRDSLEALQDRGRKGPRILWAIGWGLAITASGLLTIWILDTVLSEIF